MTNYTYDDTCPMCKSELRPDGFGKDDAGLPYRLYVCPVCGHKEADYDDTDAHEWAEDNKQYRIKDGD